MGEEETLKLLNSINENSVELREILKEIGEIDDIVAGEQVISPRCVEHLEEADKEKIAGSESVRYDMGEIILELKGDKEVEFSKDSVLLSDEGFEERKEKYIERLEAEGYEVQ